MIKKLSWMFIFVLTAVCFSSCSDDDDEPGSGSVNAAYIIGKWQGVSSTGWEKEDGKVVDKWNDDEPDFEYIEFKDNATGEWKDEYGTSYKFNWYIGDNNQLVIGEEYVGDGTGEYYNIKSLSKDKLVLTSGDNDPEDGWYQEDTYKRIN